MGNPTPCQEQVLGMLASSSTGALVLYAHGLLDDFTQVSEKVFAAATCGRAFCAQLDGNGDPIDLTGAVMFEVIEDMAADRHLIACMREALEIIKQRLGVAEQGESLEAST